MKNSEVEQDEASEKKLNVTARDNLNARNAADAFCYHLTELWDGIPVRAIETKRANEEYDFRLEYFQNGSWHFFARLECKARTFFPPPKVSQRKINTLWKECQTDGAALYLALWFDEWPERLYHQQITSAYFRTAVVSWLEHAGREGNGEDAYEFPRPYMDWCPIHAKRLNSINSKR